MLKRKQAMSDEPAQQKPLRLWPGIIIVALQWLLRYAAPVIAADDDVILIGVLAAVLCWLALLVWWIFFSRASRIDRWGAAVLMVIVLIATSYLIHNSIGEGMMGLMYYIYAMPVQSLVFVIWAVASGRLPDRSRRLTMVATILLACGWWVLVRSDGMASDTSIDLAWRWADTAEERLLAESENEPMVPLPDLATADTGKIWPGFRGHNRDGIIHGVQIETNWSESPPVELWRRAIGPGCSSFAVRGPLFYTQEQRGEYEIVSCYLLSTGKPVWRHSDKARFWDSHAGAGPRGTPTLSGDHLYTLGATGILNVLNARDGSVVWSRNTVSDTDAKIPGWGISSSPLVLDDLVIVAVVGRLVAYDLATGDLRWSGPDGGESYSSPHLLRIDGVEQVLLMSPVGATSLSPSDGKLLWNYPYPADGRIIQPALVAEGDLLLGAGNKSMRRVAVTHSSDGWTVKERWTSVHLKPNHCDIVIHKDHIYGFKGPYLSCIDMKDGTRKWRGGRYGGFLVLLADQDLLLILSEKGEVALVEATADQFNELETLQAVEGKTWSHPVLVGDILLVRNSREMVAYQLSLTCDGSKQPSI